MPIAIESTDSYNQDMGGISLILHGNLTLLLLHLSNKGGSGSYAEKRNGREG